jgi:hypothetical protein
MSANYPESLILLSMGKRKQFLCTVVFGMGTKIAEGLRDRQPTDLFGIGKLTAILRGTAGILGI